MQSLTAVEALLDEIIPEDEIKHRIILQTTLVNELLLKSSELK